MVKLLSLIHIWGLKYKSLQRTVDTGATVSIVRPDLISNRQPLIRSCTIQTITGSPVKVLGKVDVRVRLGPVSYTHLDVYKRQV